MRMEDIRNFLSEADEDDIESLKRIIEYEDKEQKEIDRDPDLRGCKPWWTLSDVLVDWHFVKKLRLKNIVIAEGGRRKSYYLADRNKVKKALKELGRKRKTAEKKRNFNEKIEIPKDLFDVVEGFDELKEFIIDSLKADGPVHILLVGSPGTAKSLILSEIEKLGAVYVTAGTATKVGIRDILFERLPRILIVDELDKVSDPRDIDTLLTWMQDGRVIITKHKQHEERQGKGWVFGAANSLRGISSALRDRFQVFHIKPYEPDQYKRVVTNYLVKREGVKRELAKYIAERTAEYTNSVREAIRIARIAKTKKKVDKIIATIQKFREV